MAVRDARTKLLSMIGALVVLGACVAAWTWWSERGVLKLFMPCVYHIELKKDLYSFWYFWRWPSKNVLERGPVASDIRITKLPGASSVSLPSAMPIFEHEFLDKAGLELFQMNLDGEYVIRSSQKCVILIVPQEHYHDMGEMILIDGPWTDFNFSRRTISY